MFPLWSDLSFGQANWNPPTRGEEFPIDLSYEVGPPESAQGYSSSLAGAYGFNTWELPELPQPASGIGGFSLDCGTSLCTKHFCTDFVFDPRPTTSRALPYRLRL
ncbi:hypothetical protein B0H13DRAFT_1850982 [Mycena leptocephala]|nr:hypothetical protein B0H13DRAFT_1850982 [Mycena leptocephala]